MEKVPQYELVFLNELHDKLRRLDPRRTPVAGLYRILGRLVEYDLVSQIAKIESCFHHDYITLHFDTEVKPIKARSDDHTIVDLTQGKDEDGTPREEQQQQQQQEGSQANLQSGGIIEKTPAMEVDTLGHESESPSTTHFRSKTVKSKKGKEVIRDPILPSPPPSSSLHQQSLDSPLPPSQQEKQKQQQTHPVRVVGPKVTLRINTQLLQQWKYELQALFQFIGEVMYENEHWVLQARTYRNMDGLDLYSFRQSILMTRALMQKSKDENM